MLLALVPKHGQGHAGAGFVPGAEVGPVCSLPGRGGLAGFSCKGNLDFYQRPNHCLHTKPQMKGWKPQMQDESWDGPEA